MQLCASNREWAAAGQLRLAGLGLTALWALTWLFHEVRGLADNPTAFELFQWLLAAAAVAAWLAGYRALRALPDGRGRAEVVGFAAAFCLLALVARPFDSSDVHGYINRGW